MKKNHSALFAFVTALIFVPALAEAATAISTLGPATAANTFDNGNFMQEWQWSTLTNGTGLALDSNNTTATAGNVLQVTTEGTNSTSGVTTYAGVFQNLKGGTNSSNYALGGFAQGGSHNYGVYGQITSTTASDASVWGDARGTSGATYAIYGTNGSSTGYAGYFNNSNGGYAAAFMGGFVGIGTPSPNKTLQVRAAANETLQLTGHASTTSGTTIRSIKDDYTVWEPVEIIGSTTILGMAGNVGVATTSPSYTLQVNGSVAGTSAYVNTSDARYKKNVKPLQIGLNEIAQLKPVSFEWKDEAKRLKSVGPDGELVEDHRPADPAMQGQQIGFVAQDVEKILPSVVVTEDNAEKTKGMKYSELIPVLVKAMQEQQAEIAALKSKLGMQ
jgi:hypothetical protein